MTKASRCSNKRMFFYKSFDCIVFLIYFGNRVWKMIRGYKFDIIGKKLINDATDSYFHELDQLLMMTFCFV